MKLKYRLRKQIFLPSPCKQGASGGETGEGSDFTIATI